MILRCPVCALFLALLLTAAQGVRAQQPYLRASAGWNFPFLTQTVAGDGTLYAGNLHTLQGTAGAEIKTYELKGASFGAGGAVTLAAGIGLTEHASIELAASFGILNRHFTYTATEADEYGDVTTRTVDATAERPVILMPAVCFRGSGARLMPYLRAGPALPLATARVIDATEEHRTRSSFRNYTLAAQWIESSRFAVGVHATLGASLRLWDRTSLFAEGSATALQVYIRKRTYTALFLNAEDVMNHLADSERTVWYEKNFVDAGSTPTGTTVRPAYAIPFSTLGIAAGLRVGW